MKIDIPAFKHCFIGGTSLLTAYSILVRYNINPKIFYINFIIMAHFLYIFIINNVNLKHVNT